MDSAVQPATPKPLYNSNMETLVHIAIDVLATKLHKYVCVHTHASRNPCLNVICCSRVHLLYVSTADGRIKKISVLPRTKQTCVVEVWNPSPVEHPVQIRTLQYLKETDSVYVGLETGVLRIPTSHCERHKTKYACHSAMDPHCGWNELLLQCTTAPDRNPLTLHWLQSVTECPLLHVPGRFPEGDSVPAPANVINERYVLQSTEAGVAGPAGSAVLSRGNRRPRITATAASAGRGSATIPRRRTEVHRVPEFPSLSRTALSVPCARSLVTFEENRQ